MSRARLVLVTRRYWPLVGGRESTLARLAESFTSRGAEVTILTPRWDRAWPVETIRREARIVRLPPPRRGMTGFLNQLRLLRRWFHEHRHEVDLAWVEQLKHDACAVVSAAQRDHFPVVLQPSQPGPDGDCHWQIDARCGARIKRYCQRADAFVAHSRQLERELIAAGYARERIHYVPLGVPLREPVGAEERAASRRDLDHLDEKFSLPGEALVILYLGTLQPGRGLPALVDAFRMICPKFPNARLWMAGAGTEDAVVAGRIARLGLGGRVTLVGTFDDAEQLVSACDVAVFPTEIDRLPVAMLEVMMAGLPVVAGDVASVREHVRDEVEGFLVPPGRSDLLAARLTQLLEDRELRERLGAAARSRVLETASLARMADEAWEIVTRLVADRQRSR